MSRKPTTQFGEEDDGSEVVVAEPTPTFDDGRVSARVKGTWNMMWGNTIWNFQDGNRYRLPRDLFTYLKEYGNIYDTMA